MATMIGNDGSISVNSIVLANVRNFSVELTADTIETTIMGTDARTFVKGLSQFSGSADIYFDPTEYGNGNTTFNLTTGLVGASGVAVKFYLDQDATNDVAFTGTCVITGYTVNSSTDGLVEASISFQGSGSASFGNTGTI
jgi:hypothetical protein